MLALSDEMREFLRQNVNPGATDSLKLQQLVERDHGDQDLPFGVRTRTREPRPRPSGVRKGNCLSFTHALRCARTRGAVWRLNSKRWTSRPIGARGANVFVLNRHVNVSIDLGAGGTRAVDFNIGDFQSTYDVDEISDRRAVAHFFNNMGVERMQSGEIVDAFVFLRRAILETDGRFSPAWTNLGLLYWKSGHDDYAEAAYPPGDRRGQERRRGHEQPRPPLRSEWRSRPGRELPKEGQ